MSPFLIKALYTNFKLKNNTVLMNQKSSEESTDQTKSRIEGLLWFILCLLILAVVFVLSIRYWDKIKTSFNQGQIENFDEMVVTNGFHDINLENGQAWDLSYETGVVRSFTGLVRHTSPINEPAFAILTFDILVTSGQFSDPELVETSVSNHHFTWNAPTLADPEGTINLLHTVPMNEEINQQLSDIREGDTVIISGYEIYQITGYDSAGNYVGYWEDAGCNTTLVTSVKIVQRP